MIYLLLVKISFLFYRVGEILIRVFKRILRFLFHPRYLFSSFAEDLTYYKEASLLTRLGLWMLEWLILILDIVGLPEWYESFADILKFNTRPLTKNEMAIGQSVFGSSINWERVRIDERSYIGPKQKRMIYVSFYTINAYGPMSIETFVHELVHIWQFENVGSCYIPRALFAQTTTMGYNYGGLNALILNMEKNGGLAAFNYEQQADIVMDYFNLKTNRPLKWSNANQANFEVFEYYWKEVYD